MWWCKLALLGWAGTQDMCTPDTLYTTCPTNTVKWNFGIRSDTHYITDTTIGCFFCCSYHGISSKMHVFYGRSCYNGRDNKIKMLHTSILRTLIEISWTDPPQHFLWADTLATSVYWPIHHFSNPRNHSSIHSRGDRIFSCTQRSPSLLFSGYKGPFSQG